MVAVAGDLAVDARVRVWASLRVGNRVRVRVFPSINLLLPKVGLISAGEQRQRHPPRRFSSDRSGSVEVLGPRSSEILPTRQQGKRENDNKF